MTLQDTAEPPFSALRRTPPRSPSRTMKAIDLVCLDGGAARRGTAPALQSVIREQRRAWLVRLVELSDLLEREAAFGGLRGITSPATGLSQCARGWQPTGAREARRLQRIIRRTHAALVARLEQHWLRNEPDLVVSLVPFFNRVLYESVTRALPGVPFVTLLTDLADHPPHGWIEASQSQHLVCGTAEAVAQARAAGYDDGSISLTSGMVLRPDFYRPASTDRKRDRIALGLDPQRPTGIVMFGVDGSSQMTSIARVLGDVQLVLMCGHDEALALKLRSLRRQAPHAVVGYTPEVSRYLRLSDFFIGRPGSTSLSEAVQCGLPVITTGNALTLLQHRYNARWVQGNGLGLVVRSTCSLRAAVVEMIERLPEFRQRVRRIENRALFEVPEILADLLNAAYLPMPLLRWPLATASNAA